MSTLLAFVVAGLVARSLVFAFAGVLASPLLGRDNYRGHHLPTAGGLVIVLTVVLVEGLRSGVGALGIGEDRPDTARVIVLLAVLGFGLLGLLDDLLGDHHGGEGRERGFRGHLRALGQGRVTTGFVKLAGGGALALVLVSVAHSDTGIQAFVDAALIALAANFANLLDRAPGRATKFAMLGYVPIAVLCGTGATGVATAVVLGAAVATLPDDLREHLMLGDTGANVVGAVLGTAIVLDASTGTRLVVAAALLAANAVSEFVSFGRVIARVAPLRAFDELGRSETA